MFGIHETERLHVFDTFHPMSLRFLEAFKVRPSECRQHFHVPFLVPGVFPVKVTENIPHTQSVTADFVRIGWADAFTGCTYLVLPFCSFVCTVKDTVCRHDEVCLL